MMRSPATPLAIAKWATIASVIVALGCTTAQTATTLIYPESQWSTPLPPGVSSNPQEFRYGLSRMMLRPSDSIHIRARAGTCLFCIVHVRIQALGETSRIKHDSAPPTAGPVAEIRNLDATHTEARYGFRPDTEAIYYFWVDRRPDANRPRMTVLQVPVREGLVRAGHQSNLELCHLRRPGVARTSDADFLEYRDHGRPCDPSLAGAPPITKASMFPGAQIVAVMSRFAVTIGRGMLISQGGWIDCNSGCCR
jgi:hypothetical protein